MNDDNGGEYGRPRRPSPETVSYLAGLPLDESVAAQEAREYVARHRNGKKHGGKIDGDGESEDAPPEYPPMLSASHAALSSIFREVGSLACEELPSAQVETLVRICCRYSHVAKRVLLTSLQSYWVFLSTHRFGSHVAQTVLRCAVAECEVNLDDFDEEARLVVEDSYGDLLRDRDGGGDVDAAVPHSLSQILLQSIEELKQYATDLAVHVCGSHVLRTSLCILFGVEFVDAFPRPGPNERHTGGPPGEWDTGVLAATRRGKLKDKKKKKKKKGGSSQDGSGGSSHQEATVMKAMKMVDELQSATFKKDTDALLKEIVDIITFSDGRSDGKVPTPGDLQKSTCHPSAGPLLIQVLRLLSFRDFHSHPDAKKRGNDGKKEIVPDRRLCILPEEPRYSAGSHAESVVHHLLCWDSNVADEGDDANATKQPHAGDIIYGLSGEPRGSVLLETIFRCCPDSFHHTLCCTGGFYDEDTLREYIQHGVSNFVVQTILTSVRSKEQVSRMVKCLCGIVEDGSILKGNSLQSDDIDKSDEVGGKPNSRRMGIVWRSFEMCATKGSSQDQEQILSALLRGFASMATSDEDRTADDSKIEDKKRRKRSKAKGLSVDDCIPKLLGMSPSSFDGETDCNRLTLDAAGARAMYHVFHFKERLRADWVNGVLKIYSRNDLVSIANDGLGSRCIIDGLLEGPSRSVASKKLVATLSDRILYLATERVGHHAVEKLFRALSTQEKAGLSADLSQSLNKLGSNAMGRSVMATCAVKEYLEGEKAWKNALAGQRNKDDWLKEITGDDSDSDKGGTEVKKSKKRKKHKKEHKNETRRKV